MRKTMRRLYNQNTGWTAWIPPRDMGYLGYGFVDYGYTLAA